jgi:MFS family permease
MKTTRRRYWVFFLLFLFNLIAYVDRVNMSVAGKPIAQEFGLSPVALGYLFSSFLWAYVLMMLPGGRLIDRWGAHVMASIATAVWSAAQMATGAASSFATMLVTRLGLGIGEAPFAPVTYRSVRAWAPYTDLKITIIAERGQWHVRLESHEQGLSGDGWGHDFTSAWEDIVDPRLRAKAKERD